MSNSKSIENGVALIPVAALGAYFSYWALVSAVRFLLLDEINLLPPCSALGCPEPGVLLWTGLPYCPGHYPG